MVRRLLLPAFLVALALAGNGQAACVATRASGGYTSKVERALRAHADVWGNELLRAPGGPTFARASRYLAPLRYARGPKGQPLTRSGVYYLPFAQPEGAQGAGSVALHVADGSEIVSQRVGGAGVRVAVGGAPFGACRGERLAEGWLPILETRDRGYVQESFAARVGSRLVSFVRVTGPGTIAFTPSDRRRLVAGPGGRWAGGSLRFVRTAYVAWLNTPGRRFALDAARYSQARASVVDYWTRRLGEGASFEVPERHVMDAERALLVQNLALTWRYSIGNPYEQFSFPESVDGAQVMGELGFDAVSRSMLRVSLTRRPVPYPNWKMGERLLGAARHYELFADPAFVAQLTPTLSRYVGLLAGKLDARGLMGRERYSSDIPDDVYGFHSQAVVWQGLTRMADVWTATGHAPLAVRARSLASRLESGLRRAVRTSQRRLADGSTFFPARLLDSERPYGTLTESRSGSYWNLVMPYAFASGVFAPGSPESRGAFRYMLLHGSRLLGLVRAGAYAVYGRDAPPSLSGTDQVYGLNVARFLAAEDEPDQLVLSFYGQLAAGMTPKTFVAGEAASVAPLAGRRYRAMYLPPNSASNNAWLATLRLLLVQETPTALRLAYATPRAWLDPGRRIGVSNVPTRFGPLGYSLEAAPGSVHVQVEVPSRTPPKQLLLCLRLPAGKRILSVTPSRPFEARTGTIDLSGMTGSLDLIVHTS